MERKKLGLLFVTLVALVATLLMVVPGCTGGGGGGTTPTATGTSEKKFNIKLAAICASEGTEADLVRLLMKEYEDRSGGRITTEIHWGYELMGGPQAIEACAAGSLEMIEGAPYDDEGFDPRWGICNVPFLWNNMDHMIRFSQTKSWADWMKWNEDHGLRMTNYEGYMISQKMAQDAGLPDYALNMQVYSNFNWSTLSDLKGKNFRVLPGPTYAKVGELLNMKTFSVSSSELPVALQTGMVDIMHGGGSESYCTSLGIVPNMKYFWLNPHFDQSLYPMYMSQKLWKSLPADLQKAVNDSNAEWAPIAQQANLKDWVSYYAFLKKNMTEIKPTKEVIEEFRTKLAPIRDVLAPEVKAMLPDIDATFWPK